MGFMHGATELWILDGIQHKPKQKWNVLWRPFHCDYRNVLNDKVVTYEASQSNSTK
jgi:hypothetical protein